MLIAKDRAIFSLWVINIMTFGLTIFCSLKCTDKNQIEKYHTNKKKQLVLMATSSTKASVEKFVPSSQKVYGVKMPLLNDLCKELKENGFSLVYQLWESGAFEEKMLAAKLVGKLSKKQPLEALAAVEKFSASIEDWAIYDTLGMQSLKPIAGTHQKEIFSLAKKLNPSANFWQRRLSLVLVEVYARDNRFHSAINKLIKQLENDKEYYVKKAITWLNKSINKYK